MNFDLASVDYILETTRSVRKRLDLTRPVDRAAVERCLEIAIQAPTGSNRQGWKWLIVTDAEKKAKIGEYYKRSWYAYAGVATRGAPGEEPSAQMRRRHQLGALPGRLHARGSDDDFPLRGWSRE